MTTTIPYAYRIFFTTIDPIIAASGIIVNQFPSLALSSYASNPVLPPSTETRLLLDAMSTCFACFTFLEIFLLRAAPENLAVWKIFEAGILITDFGMIGAFLRALSSAGRPEPSLWRAEEWTNIGTCVIVGIIRAMFLLDIGMSKREKKRKQ